MTTSPLAPLAPVPERPRRLVYLGTPEMAVPPLEALAAAGYEIPLVITRGDARHGRGAAMTPSPVKAAAERLGLPVSHTVDEVLDAGAELGVVVAYGRLIRRHVLAELPMINLHFSLLPRWRGAAPVERALLAGDPCTGTCVMQLEEGLDTGPVYDRVEVPIAPRQTAAELRTALVDAGTAQLLRVLGGGLRNPQPQTGEPTYASKIERGELEIDWCRPAAELDRLVRLGGAWTTVEGKRLKVIAAEPIDRPGPPAGRVEGLDTGTADGVLRLVTVQPEGKPAMDAAAWRNGLRAGSLVLGG